MNIARHAGWAVAGDHRGGKHDYCRGQAGQGSARRAEANRSCRTSAMVLFAASAVMTSPAQESNVTPPAPAASPATERRYLPWEKGAVKVGGFVSSLDSTLTFSRSGGSSATFNAEDRLGLDSTLTVIRVEGLYRPGKSLRHQLDFSWGGYHRDGQATVSEAFTIGDSTYPVGADLNTLFDFDVIRLTYSYAFVQNERLRFGMGLGAFVIPLEYELDITTGGNRTVAEGSDTTLPLPSLALRAEYQVIPKLFLNFAVDGMYLEVSDFTGGLLEGTVALEYRPWKHLGLGLGYSGLIAEVESETDSDYPGADFIGQVHVGYNGLLLYGKFSF